ncbi:hypothetical protein ACFQ6V_33655, partial [Streptomyces roseifaciens]
MVIALHGDVGAFKRAWLRAREEQDAGESGAEGLHAKAISEVPAVTAAEVNLSQIYSWERKDVAKARSFLSERIESKSYWDYT